MQTHRLIPVRELVKATEIRALDVFKAAAEGLIELAVPVSRGTAHTFIAEFVATRIDTVDIRLLRPVCHPGVCAFILPPDVCHELVDCGRASSATFVGGWVQEEGLCSKKLLVLKRNFIPGRDKLEWAERNNKPAEITEECLGSDIDLIRDGGTYCLPIDEAQLLKLTERYRPLRWSVNFYWHYKFGQLLSKKGDMLVSVKEGIQQPQEIKIDHENVLITTSDLVRLERHIGRRSLKLQTFIQRHCGSQYVEPRSDTIVPLGDQARFKRAQGIAQEWVDNVCGTRFEVAKPVPAVYGVASVAVLYWLEVEAASRRPSRKHICCWLEDVGLAKSETMVLAAIICGDSAMNGSGKKSTSLKVKSGSELWKRTNFQLLLECWRDAKKKGEGIILDESLFIPSDLYVTRFLNTAKLADSAQVGAIRLFRRTSASS